MVVFISSVVSLLALQTVRPVSNAIMDNFVHDNALSGTFVYLDNVIVCGMDQAQHDSNLDKLLAAAKKYNFTFNEQKSSYSQSIINFLGYTISNGTLKPDPDRLRPLRDFPVPTDTASLRRAVGMLVSLFKLDL